MVGNDQPAQATFLLTRNAALDLRLIHTRSRREWGDDVADKYLADLYTQKHILRCPPPKIRIHRNSQPEKNYFFEDIKKLINFLQWFEFAQSESPPCLSVNDTARR
jgi:hypothetical protein